MRAALWRRLLGAGMLERARATSLALLGATAAVGLAMVAIAANQGWPLLAGSAIPRLRQDLGGATVVARPGGRRPVGAASPLSRRRARAGGPSVPPGAASGGVPSGTSPEPAATSPEPVRTEGGVGHGAPSHQQGPSSQRTPHAPHPSNPAPASASPPAKTPETAPVSTSPPASQNPPATVSEAPPEESNVPPWSNGRGHAYGRSEDHHDG